MDRTDRSTLLKSIIAAVILSSVALLDFVATNLHHLSSATRVVKYGGATLAIIAVCALIVKWLQPRLPLWRILLAVGVMAFIFCSYNALGGLQKRLQPHLGAWLPLAWIGLSIASGCLALIFLRRRAAASVLLMMSLAFAAPSLARIVVAVANSRATPTVTDDRSKPMAGRISPNIYWIVLDGYPRQDVLKKDFAFDNSAFLQEVRGFGFSVLDKSLANFPTTMNSVSSTLNMDYTVRADDTGMRTFLPKEMYSIIKGGSRVVSQLTAMGYSYVHFENGYDYGTACGDGEQRCIRGNVGLDEFDTAVLSNTPIIDLILDREQLIQRSRPTTFAWGGVSDLTAKLDLIVQTPSPFFVYAHILAPHPPIRFRADCSSMPAEPDLQGWDPAMRPAFIEQLKCVNAQTLVLLQKVVGADPGALIVLQSDHGTAFRDQFAKPPSQWSDADLHERFAALNAMRLPAPCRTSPLADLTLVDTFPLVLSCLTGDPFTPHRARVFVPSNEGNTGFEHVFEYPVERVR